MTAPATEVPAQPDCEAWVWSALAGLDGITMWCYDATPMPLVPWLVAYSFQIDARARGKQAAWALAEKARRIIWGLGSRPWPAGVVSYVQVTDGPMWLADDDGTPRYVLRAEVRVHPVPRPAPAPMTGPLGPGQPEEEMSGSG
jgi:hypothetical protein